MRSVSVRAVKFVCAVAALAEVLFYAALAPMLPSLEGWFGLSHAGAGALVASYGIGYGLGTYPSVRLSASVGPRSTALTGALFVVVGTVAFAVAPNLGLLFAGCTVSGIGSAMLNTGVIVLATASVGSEHRGSVIGTIYGGDDAGSAAGPLIGAVAESVGRGPVFGLLALAQLAVAGLMTRLPSVPAAPMAGFRKMIGHLRSARVRLGLRMSGLPDFGLGVLVVSGSLRIAEAGGSALLIATVFSCIAAVSVVAEPIVGRISDELGLRRPLLVLVLSAVVSIGLLIPADNRNLIAALVAISGALLAPLGSPGFALICDAVERRGGDDAQATFLMNLFWGPIAASGAAVAGIFHGAVGAQLSFALLAMVTLVSAGLVFHYER